MVVRIKVGRGAMSIKALLSQYVVKIINIQINVKRGNNYPTSSPHETFCFEFIIVFVNVIHIFLQTVAGSFCFDL